MAESTLTEALVDLQNRLGRFLGWHRTVGSWNSQQALDADDILMAAYRRFLLPPILSGEKNVHEWSFLKPVRPITLSAAYSIGTVTISSGVVTLTVAGTFPSWAAQGELIHNGTTYTVNTRDGANQVTLDDTSLTDATATAYTLIRPYYALPDDFQGLEGPVTFAPGVATAYRPIEIVPEHQIRSRRQSSDITGRPTVAAVRPIPTHDPTEGQRWEMMFWPHADEDYVLSYKSRLAPAKLATTNIYAVGGMQFSDLLVAAVLAEGELTINDEYGIWNQRFMELLPQAISMDRLATTPEFTGYNGDSSDRTNGGNHHNLSGNLVTYNGSVG